MTRKISMNDGMQVAQRAAQDIEAWLHSLPQTQTVLNVEADPAYQAEDVDLLWTTDKQQYRVEIKGDRWHQTGNFFFETHSNEEKGTPGCFMYTRADLLFYYFVDPRILYIMPMPATRDWFIPRLKKFRERRTTTPAGEGFYTTVGRLVPIEMLRRMIPDIRKLKL